MESFSTMGRRQVVRHQVLVLAFGGSNPSAPARDKSKILPLVGGVFYLIPDLSGLDLNPAGSMTSEARHTLPFLFCVIPPPQPRRNKLCLFRPPEADFHCSAIPPFPHKTHCNWSFGNFVRGGGVFYYENLMKGVSRREVVFLDMVEMVFTFSIMNEK